MENINDSSNSLHLPVTNPVENILTKETALELPLVEGVDLSNHNHDSHLDDSDSQDESHSGHPQTKFINESDIIKEEKKELEAPEREKKGGRRKINIEFIENKSRRHVTFSKRKAGLIKKVLSLLTFNISLSM